MPSEVVGFLRAILSLNSAEFQADAQKAAGQSKNLATAIQNVGGTATTVSAQTKTLATSIQGYSGAAAAATTQATALARATAAANTNAAGLGTAVAGTTNKMGAFVTSVDSVDRVLGSVGINIGRHVGGLRELAAASGQTASQMGLISTAGFAVASAMVGINIGRWIGEWSGLTKSIQDGTAALLGWGDVVGEEATERARILGEASVIAGRGVRNFAEAIKILDENGRRNSIMMIDFAAQLQQAEDHIAGLDAEMLKRIETDRKANATLEDLNVRYGLTALGVKLLDDRLKSEADAQRDATKAADEWLKKQDALFGKDLIARANEFVRLLGNVNNIAKLSIEKKEELRKVVLEAINAYERLGRTAPQVLRDIEAATRPLLVSTRQWVVTGLKPAVEAITPFAASVRNLGMEMRGLEVTAGGVRQTFIGLKEPIEDTREGIRDTTVEARGLSSEIGENLTQVLSSLPQTFANAFTGGGGIVGAFKAIGVQIAEALIAPIIAAFGKRLAGAVVGNFAGSIAGTAASGTGTAVAAAGLSTAALIGGGVAAGLVAWGLYMGNQRKKEREFRAAQEAQFNTIRQSLIESVGPTGNLDASMKAVGLDFSSVFANNGIFAPSTEERLRRIIALQAEFAKRVGETNDKFSPLLQSATSLGQKLPDSLLASIGHLVNIGVLTGNNADLFHQLAGQQEIDWQRMEQAAERYGVDIGSLGQKFHGAKLHSSFEQLLDDFELLKAGGADVGGVLFGMKDEINALVLESKRAGTAIPENFRWIIQHLIEQGHLVDENGNALQDMAGINFGDPIVRQFDRIVEAIEKMIAALGALPGAINAIPPLPSPDFPTPGSPVPTPPPGTPPPPGEPPPENPRLGFGGLSRAIAGLGSSFSMPSMALSPAFAVPSMPSFGASAFGGSDAALAGGPPTIVIIDGTGKGSAQLADEALRAFPRAFAGNLHDIRVVVTDLLQKRGR